MSSISIIGAGNMARTLADRALTGGNTVEIIGRDPGKANELAKTLGDQATTAETPTGDIVILAVPAAAAVPIVEQYGNDLAGKIIIDITNPVNADATALVTPDNTSAAQQIANAAPKSAHVVKAFNTVFGHVLTPNRSLDVLFAGDDEHAKAEVRTFIESLGLRPLDAGGLDMARWLEGTGLLMISLARNGVGDFNFTLDVNHLSNS